MTGTADKTFDKFIISDRKRVKNKQLASLSHSFTYQFTRGRWRHLINGLLALLLVAYFVGQNSKENDKRLNVEKH